LIHNGKIRNRRKRSWRCSWQRSWQTYKGIFMSLLPLPLGPARNRPSAPAGKLDFPFTLLPAK
jgi:hypothetical protein